MAVEFMGVNGQGIQFGNIPAANNLVDKSISIHFFADVMNAVYTLIDKYTAANGWWVDENTGGLVGKIQYAHVFNVQTGYWHIDTAPSTGIWHHLAVTYNNSNTTNDPIFYLDGTIVASTEEFPPVGAAVLETANIDIGYDSFTANTTMDGKEQDPRLYNRILSATEVEQLYYSRCQNVVLDGLVFWAPLNGAAGMPKFEGVAMGASNTVRDVISGAIGTPAGNPLGAGNTIQRIR